MLSAQSDQNVNARILINANSNALLDYESSQISVSHRIDWWELRPADKRQAFEVKRLRFIKLMRILEHVGRDAQLI